MPDTHYAQLLRCAISLPPKILLSVRQLMAGQCIKEVTLTTSALEQLPSSQEQENLDKE